MSRCFQDTQDTLTWFVYWLVFITSFLTFFIPQKPSRESPVDAAAPSLLGQIFSCNHSVATKPRVHTHHVPEGRLSTENIQQALNLILTSQWDKQADLSPFRPESFETLVRLALEQTPQVSVTKGQETPKSQTSQTTAGPHQSEAQSVEQLLEHLFGGEQKQPHESASSLKAHTSQLSSFPPAPHAKDFKRFLELLTGAAQQSDSSMEAQAAQPSSSQAASQAHPEGSHPFLKLFKGEQQPSVGSACSSMVLQPSPPSPQSAPQAQYVQPEGLQQFLNLLLGGQQQQQQQATPQASSSSKPQSYNTVRPEFGGFEEFMNALLGQQKEQQVN
jgi:hypothetical protein